jgi:hypothetical protein
MRLFDCNWNLFSEDLDGFSVCAWMGLKFRDNDDDGGGHLVTL